MCRIHVSINNFSKIPSEVEEEVQERLKLPELAPGLNS
jgi:hypothetical protein